PSGQSAPPARGFKLQQLTCEISADVRDLSTAAALLATEAITGHCDSRPGHLGIGTAQEQVRDSSLAA
ncbi:hypothetical protein B8W95_13505, partial [Staphylococcus pasteuri]